MEYKQSPFTVQMAINLKRCNFAKEIACCYLIIDSLFCSVSNHQHTLRNSVYKRKLQRKRGSQFLFRERYRKRMAWNNKAQAFPTLQQIIYFFSTDDTKTTIYKIIIFKNNNIINIFRRRHVGRGCPVHHQNVTDKKAKLIYIYIFRLNFITKQKKLRLGAVMLLLDTMYECNIITKYVVVTFLPIASIIFKFKSLDMPVNNIKSICTSLSAFRS